MITEFFTTLVIALYSAYPALASINNTCQRIESGCVSLGDYCIPQNYCSDITICSNLCSINYSCSHNRLCSSQIEGDICADNTGCVGENLPSMLEPYMMCNNNGNKRGRCVIDKNPTKLLPNDNCTSNNNCLSSVCSNTTYLSPGIYVCLGGSKNDKCNQNKDCDPGFFCDHPSNTCKNQIPSGMTGCNKDSDCLSRLDNCQSFGHGNKICYTINSANDSESCISNDECKDGYFCLNGICSKSNGISNGLACYDSTVKCSKPDVCACNYNIDPIRPDHISCQPFACNSPFMCEKNLVNYCVNEEAEYRMCLNNNNCHSESDPQKYGSCAFKCLSKYKTYKLCTVQIGLEFAQESCRSD